MHDTQVEMEDLDQEMQSVREDNQLVQEKFVNFGMELLGQRGQI